MPDASVDMVWISGVLKYTLFPPGTPCLHCSADADRNRGVRADLS